MPSNKRLKSGGRRDLGQDSKKDDLLKDKLGDVRAPEPAGGHTAVNVTINNTVENSPPIKPRKSSKRKHKRKRNGITQKNRNKGQQKKRKKKNDGQQDEEAEDDEKGPLASEEAETASKADFPGIPPKAVTDDVKGLEAGSVNSLVSSVYTDDDDGFNPGYVSDLESELDRKTSLSFSLSEDVTEVTQLLAQVREKKEVANTKRKMLIILLTPTRSLATEELKTLSNFFTVHHLNTHDADKSLQDMGCDCLVVDLGHTGSLKWYSNHQEMMKNHPTLAVKVVLVGKRGRRTNYSRVDKYTPDTYIKELPTVGASLVEPTLENFLTELAVKNLPKLTSKMKQLLTKLVRCLCH